MLELNTIRNQKDSVIEGYKKRNLSEQTIAELDAILALDDERKTIQTQLDNALAEINALSKEVGDLFKAGKQDQAGDLKTKVAGIKEGIKSLEQRHKDIKDLIEEKLLSLPNVPHESVPFGKGAEDNEVFKSWDKAFPSLPENALPHWELAEKYDLFSLSLGAHITGSGFPVYKGKGARLQRALISFFLDEATDAGFTEIIPPLLVNKHSARGTGQLPDKEGQMYYCEKDDLYLIPTAEVPITNLYRDAIIGVDELPIKMTGYTPCFRREAGSYGSDVKGLNRVHQFDKVEVVVLQHPDKSYDTLMDMVNHVEGLLIKLELPYRILRLCGGDMGFNSALTFDFEVYSAAQEKWLEVSSVSNFESFQANRMMLRYKDTDGKNKLAHTLNGSALALARIVASLLENNQTRDGIDIPYVLRQYTGFDKI
ncbi:MAG: serine--tRNA ligase [Saprospiraceae bacterium]|nr:serine--tRNA ligase [Saprospiraceae bacterium]